MKVGIKSLAMGCLKKLGFTDQCAETWYYNMCNTSRNCLNLCLKSVLTGESYNKEDGSLNDCLKCDEEKSGPIFKRAAGRTRRNSGIKSAINRKVEEVYPIVHDYY